MDLVFLSSPDLDPILTKLGYKTISGDWSKLEDANVDLIVLDCADPQHQQLYDFIRGSENTQKVPIVAINNKRNTFGDDNALEVIHEGESIGKLAGKIATQIRLRKFNGANPLSATVFEANAALRDLNDNLIKERQDARRIQQALLPSKLPTSEDLELAVHYSPLDAVGGDWYDITTFKFEGDSYTRLLIADVTGHGLAAALVGSMTKLAVNVAENPDPGKMLTRINALLVPVLPEGRFLTLALLTFNHTTKEVKIASAGHPPTILLKNGEVQLIEIRSFPIGFTEEAEYESVSHSLKVEDALLLFTDGIIEGSNRSNEMFGMERLGSTFKESKAQKGTKTIAKILGTFGTFTDGRVVKDDVTLIVAIAK